MGQPSAAQVEGEKASAEAFVSRRAALASERLSSRVPAVAHTLATVHWRPWAGWLVVAAALLAGLLLDALSADKRINILAPPILAILLWNVAVYVMLAGRAALGAPPLRQPGPGATVALRPMQRLFARLMLAIPKSLLKPDAGGAAGGVRAAVAPGEREPERGAGAVGDAPCGGRLRDRRAGGPLHARPGLRIPGGLGKHLPGRRTPSAGCCRWSSVRPAS